jgi:hypothetical protein
MEDYQEMRTRNTALCAFGLAAAITLGGAVTASAQVDTSGRARSTTRIPVRKEGAPATVTRTDTVTVRVTDTVIVRRADTVSVTRFDTVTRLVEPALQPLPGVYFGIGAGVAVPMNNWRNLTKDGPDLHAHLGWFPGVSALGLRADVNYAMFGRRETDCATCPKPKLLSGSGDVVLRIPLDRKSRINPVFYAIGGGGIDKFTDFIPYTNSEGKVVTAGKNTYLAAPGITPPLTAATAGDKSMFYHWEVGPGLAFNLGPAHLFVESKYTTVMTTNGNSHYWPIVAGLNFY